MGKRWERETWGRGGHKKGPFYRTHFPKWLLFNSFLEGVCWLYRAVKMGWKMRRKPWKGLGLGSFLLHWKHSPRCVKQLGNVLAHPGGSHKRPPAALWNLDGPRPFLSPHSATHSTRLKAAAAREIRVMCSAGGPWVWQAAAHLFRSQCGEQL